MVLNGVIQKFDVVKQNYSVGDYIIFTKNDMKFKGIVLNSNRVLFTYNYTVLDEDSIVYNLYQFEIDCIDKQAERAFKLSKVIDKL
jgi:hypothetical protein